MVVPHPSRVT